VFIGLTKIIKWSQNT